MAGHELHISPDWHIASDTLLTAALEAAGGAFIAVDPDNVVKLWGESAERMFGYSADEALGRPLALLILPETTSQEEAQVSKQLLTETTVHRFQTIRRRKDGSYLTVSVAVAPVRGAGGEVIGSCRLFADVSQEERIVEELRRSEQRYRVTLSSIGDAVIATDVAGRVTFMNSVAERLTGWSQKESYLRALDEIFPLMNEETRQHVRTPVSRVIAEGTVVGLANHTVFTARDGTERPIADSAAPIRDSQGNLTGVVLVFRDVTEERRAAITAERLAAIVENSDDAIVGKDLNGLVTSWNRGAERIFGYRATEVIGGPINVIIPLDRQDEEQQILTRLRRGERVEHFETVRVTKDGRHLDVSMTISPIKDEEGRVVGASKIARVLSEQPQG